MNKQLGVAGMAATSVRPYAIIADIGGTNARFALQLTDTATPTHISVFACQDYSGIIDVVTAYLQEQQVVMPRFGAFAIANPITGDWLQMTNHQWAFSIEHTRDTLGLEQLYFLNDFSALALSLPHLNQTHDLEKMGQQVSEPFGVKALIGAGTGVGVSGLIYTGQTWLPIVGEGGHVSYPATDAEELEILRILMKDSPILSVEHLISGRLGFPNLLKALAILRGELVPSWTAPEITHRARSLRCPLSLDVIRCFTSMLANVAGNLALTLGATGGVYLGGGIVPQLGELFDRSLFRARFEEKDRSQKVMLPIPTFIITAQYPALMGAAVGLNMRLKQC